MKKKLCLIFSYFILSTSLFASECDAGNRLELQRSSLSNWLKEVEIDGEGARSFREAFERSLINSDFEISDAFYAKNTTFKRLSVFSNADKHTNEPFYGVFLSGKTIKEQEFGFFIELDPKNCNILAIHLDQPM